MDNIKSLPEGQTLVQYFRAKPFLSVQACISIQNLPFFTNRMCGNNKIYCKTHHKQKAAVCICCFTLFYAENLNWLALTFMPYRIMPALFAYSVEQLQWVAMRTFNKLGTVNFHWDLLLPVLALDHLRFGFAMHHTSSSPYNKPCV